MSEDGTPRARGRCHCGAVEFEVRGRLRDVIVCHCEDCRRIHGHVAAHTAARWRDVKVLRDEALRWYASSDRARRAFCGRCGSGLLYDQHGRDVVSICAGALDGPAGIATAVHVFCGSAADYEGDDAGAPRRPGWPEPGDAPFPPPGG